MKSNINSSTADPPPKGFQVVERKGHSVHIDWFHPASCYPAEKVYLFYSVGNARKEHSVPASVNEFTLMSLKPETDYEVHALVQYEGGRRSDQVTFEINSGKCHKDDPLCMKQLY